MVEDPANWLLGRTFGVHFGVYAVSSYAEGEHLVEIPYAQLAKALKPEFRRLVGLP